MGEQLRFFKPGERFRGLLIHSVLGEGAMGTAYLASHPILRVPLVLKIFKGEHGFDLFKEAHLAARVTSPHVVGVVDAGFEGETPFIVQRYVDGVDLGELVHRWTTIGRRLPVGFVASTVAEIARGLHALHQAGVLHCDVKPDNLFLAGSGDALVGDLGIALAANHARAEQIEVSGTPYFMAPERWLGEEPDRRADIYALGVTAHMLANGDLPFTGEDVATIRDAHLTFRYEPPAAAAHEPRDAYFYSVLARMLGKRPAERYGSGDEVARMLDVVKLSRPALLVREPRHATVGGVDLRLAVGDLAKTEADVIVNAANRRLTMDVGVASALSAAGGPSIVDEASKLAPAGMGDVVWTGAGKLRARWMAHAVAAMVGAVCIQRCLLRVLIEAEARHARSIALPALGTGVGEVPMHVSAKRALDAVATFAALEPHHVRDVTVVLRDESALADWADELRLVAT